MTATWASGEDSESPLAQPPSSSSCSCMAAACLVMLLLFLYDGAPLIRQPSLHAPLLCTRFCQRPWDPAWICISEGRGVIVERIKTTLSDALHRLHNLADLPPTGGQIFTVSD